jgi:hypothetical protein
VKYEDYKRFGANVKILYQGKEVPKADQKDQTPAPDQKPDEKKPEAAPNPPTPQK